MRCSRGLILPIAVSVVAACLGLLGPQALPKLEESPQQYAARLGILGLALAEDLYLRALVLAGGNVRVTTSATQSGAGDVEVNPTASDLFSKQDTLKQEVANNEDEIQAQQQVSAKRYAANVEKAEDIIIPQSPDELLHRLSSLDPNGPEMQCSREIPPASSVTTRDIEVAATSTYQGESDGGHVWKYKIKFANHGQEVVQMLTRHWVFVNGDGELEAEVMGPGARGVTPVLLPGGEWNYESGTTLSAAHGSMYGSFQFEVLRGDKSSGRRSFNAWVGRLLLSSPGSQKRRHVQCPDAADSKLLPATAVLVTERVIIGMTGDFVSKKDKSTFEYNVQVNNARDSQIEVVAHSWEVVDPKGKRDVVEEGPGVGGSHGTKSRKLDAGDAFRFRGRFALPATRANAQGTFKVLITTDTGLPVEIEARTDWMGLAATHASSRVPNYVVGRSSG